MVVVITIAALPVAAQTGGGSAIVLNVETPAYELTPHSVRVDGYDFNDHPGAPSLPVWNTVVELPPAGRWQLTFQTPGATVLSQTVRLAAVLLPVTPNLGPDGGLGHDSLPTSVQRMDRPDSQIYGSSALYPPQPVVAGAEQWQRGRRLLHLQVFPFQYNPAAGRLRYLPHVQIRITLLPQEQGQSAPLGAASHLNPAASSAGSLRVLTTTRGLYRLTYDDLVGAGVPVGSVSAASFAMSYLGDPIAIELIGDGDDLFEPGEVVVFYAEPYQGRYLANNVYWFSYGGAAGVRIASRTVMPAGTEPLITTVTQTLHVEFDREYQSTFARPRDADHWFDTALSPDVATTIVTATRSYNLTLDDPLTTGYISVRAVLFGGIDRPQNPDKAVKLALNGQSLGLYTWEGSTEYQIATSAPAAWLTPTLNQLTLTAALSFLPGIDFYSVAPDWVEVTYPAMAEAEGDHIDLEALAPGDNEVAVAGFSASQVQVYDVSNPRQPVRLTTTQAVPAGASYTIHFWDVVTPASRYFLSTQAGLAAPLAVEPDTASTWRTPDHQADYIAIVHPSLWNAIVPLLAHRTAEGLAVVQVDVQDIYDEWSFGRRDPEAIREFLAYAYHNWNAGQARPAYVLLVGDGHYDFTGVSATTFPNLIPPYLINVDPWLGETAADNRFVSIDSDDDYLPDMAIGRIPARTPADVTAVVDKIIAYETTAPGGDWQRRVIFVADNNLDPAGDFHAYSDSVRTQFLPAGYEDRTVYYNRDYFTAGDMRTAIKTAFNDDALVVQWFGHGSRFRWGSASMFNIFDPPALVANDAWPFSTTYACWTGYFINLFTTGSGQALGEVLLLTPQRGSVADLSPSGLHVGEALVTLNRGLTLAVFQQRIARAGAAADAARLYYFTHASSFQDVIDTSVFFGDPALKLRLPDPQLAGSSLEADRSWAPPGAAVSFTATLTTTAPVSTTADLTLTLPSALSVPTALTATSSTPVYQASSHQVLWSSEVTATMPEQVSFASVIDPSLTACGVVQVTGDIRDGLAASTSLSASVHLAVPDVDCDGDVDIVDVQLVARHWGVSPSDPFYHPRYDLNGDEAISVLDLAVVAQAWK